MSSQKDKVKMACCLDDIYTSCDADFVKHLHQATDRIYGQIEVRDKRKHFLCFDDRHIESRNTAISIRDEIDMVEAYFKNTYNEELGPMQMLNSVQRKKLGDHIIVLNFDSDEQGEFELSYDFKWENSGLLKAAYIYKRECGWDFNPGESGIWILYANISQVTGADREWTNHFNVVGFAILQDRGENKIYETLTDLWTAKRARRRGVASALLKTARERYGVNRVEYPLTELGELFVNKHSFLTEGDIYAQPKSL